jgi:hypothetical protein
MRTSSTGALAFLASAILNGDGRRGALFVSVTGFRPKDRQEEKTMGNAAAGKTGASGAIVEKLLQTVSKDQLTQLIDVALANSGEVVGTSSFEPGDDLCPNFYFTLPFAPKFQEFLSAAVALGRVRFDQGISPDGVLVQVSIRRLKH